MHGSAELINWVIAPFKFLFGWASWPFTTLSSHLS